MTKTVLPDWLLVKANVLRASGGASPAGPLRRAREREVDACGSFQGGFWGAGCRSADGWLPSGSSRTGAPPTCDLQGRAGHIRFSRLHFPAPAPESAICGRDRLRSGLSSRSRNLSRVPCQALPKPHWSLPKGKPSARRPMGAGPCRAGRVLVCRHDEDKRLAWLLARHVTYGRSLEAAGAWIERTDVPNARLVRATREKANLLVNIAHQETVAAPESLVNIPPKLKAED